MILALACSLAAAVGGIFFDVSAKIVGGIALLPPLIAYVAVNLNLEPRSSWHYRKADAFRALHSRLMYQLPEIPTIENISEIAKDRDKVGKDMRYEWERTLTMNWSGIGNRRQESINRSNESSATPGPD